MALYAISDLHLSISIDKPMEVFGSKWDNYMQKIKANWLAQVKDEDCIIIPGDISWAMYLEQAYEDFVYLNSLPGLKIISKGNHDYWWETLKKMNQYVNEKGFENIFFLHNNSILYDDIAICGTRGWICPNSDAFTEQDEKIYGRELQRLELSIREGIKYRSRAIIVAIHYPPFNRYKEIDPGFLNIMKKYDVKVCVYGHLHHDALRDPLEGEIDGVNFHLVSCDYLDYRPLKLAV